MSLNFSTTGISKREFKTHLDKAITLNNPHAATLSIERLVREHNIKCAEIDAYIKDYRPLFLATFAKEIQDSAGLVGTKGREKEQTLHSLKLKAVQSLDVHPVNFTHNLFPLDESESPDAWTIAHLIFGTYFRIKAAAREHKQFLSPHLINVKGFKLFDSERCCPSCQRAAKQLYQKNNFPDLPFHIGCGCWLAPIFDWEN